MNVGWGAARIHGERLKLGIENSEITVSRYMPKRRPTAGSRQRGVTFLHHPQTLAIDFAVVPTVTFGIVYVFFVLSLERRRVLHFNVTQPPTVAWSAQQGVEACPFDRPGRFLIRDKDKVYGTDFRNQVDGLGREQIRTAFRSPWQNGCAERWIGSLRRDCLDPVIAIHERKLRSGVESWILDIEEGQPHRLPPGVCGASLARVNDRPLQLRAASADKYWGELPTSGINERGLRASHEREIPPARSATTAARAAGIPAPPFGGPHAGPAGFRAHGG